MIPFFLLCKPALIDYDETAITILVVYGLALVGLVIWLKKKYPEKMERWKKPYEVQNLSRPELFGFVAFVIVVMGMLGWGLMVALCFVQIEDELLVPFPIDIFLASGLLFGVFIGLPILAEGFFPKHKKIISILTYVVAGVLLWLAVGDGF